LVDLFAISQQPAREDADAEVGLGQVNPHRAIRAARVHFLHQRAAQHRLLGFIQVAKPALTGLGGKHQRTELRKEIWIPQQHRVRAQLCQLTQASFLNLGVNPRPKLTFPAEDVFHQLGGHAGISSNLQNLSVKAVLPFIHVRTRQFHSTDVGRAVGLQPTALTGTGIHQSLFNERASQQVILVHRNQIFG